ncbi:hypothetical protein FC682_06175 [Peribacillus simplex]|uniref:hypothetical protein n=1 Tax=Peribacillus simplex TaxID=1478 RepID=UPI0010BEB235|nr:hypothetical protein [Peribacillus simplex]TKH06131.1 hypothetical protein FC682_06175 [Peribacillus simplex]
MGKYSQANLIDEELSLIGSTTFIGKLLHKVNKSSTILLNIDVPLNLFLRAEVFCEDIQDLSDLHFEQNDLMNLLYNDFLLFAKKNPDSNAIFRLLTSLDKYAGKDSRLEKHGVSAFKLIHKEKNQEIKTLNLRMRRKYALRGEILLADMEEVQPEHGYTLERVFELLYIDFIDKFRKGDHAGVIENILRLLDDETE